MKLIRALSAAFAPPHFMIQMEGVVYHPGIHIGQEVRVARGIREFAATLRRDFPGARVAYYSAYANGVKRAWLAALGLSESPTYFEERRRPKFSPPAGASALDDACARLGQPDRHWDSGQTFFIDGTSWLSPAAMIPNVMIHPFTEDPELPDGLVYARAWIDEAFARAKRSGKTPVTEWDHLQWNRDATYRRTELFSPAMLARGEQKLGINGSARPLH